MKPLPTLMAPTLLLGVPWAGLLELYVFENHRDFAATEMKPV